MPFRLWNIIITPLKGDENNGNNKMFNDVEAKAWIFILPYMEEG